MADEQKQQKRRRVERLGARNRDSKKSEAEVDREAVLLYNKLGMMRDTGISQGYFDSCRGPALANLKEALTRQNFSQLEAMPELFHFFELPRAEWQNHIHAMEMRAHRDRLLEEAGLSPEVVQAFHQAAKPSHHTTLLVYQTLLQGRELLDCPFGTVMGINDLSEVEDDATVYLICADSLKPEDEKMLKKMRVIRL